MGNNLSQELRAPNSNGTNSERLVHPCTQETSTFGQNTTDLWVYKTGGHVSKFKSTGTNTEGNPYVNSCLYRRKMYAESLPKLKRTPNSLPFNSSKHSRRTNPKRQSIQSVGSVINVKASSAQHYILHPMGELPPLRLLNQQWNENNRTEYEGDKCLDPCRTAMTANSAASHQPRSLPKLLSVHQLMDRLDDELLRSKTMLKKSVDGLTDTDLLFGRSNLEQRELMRKTEESVCNTQMLLAKVHQHIANAHQFCNMLHRVDESLQMYSKTAYSVATWEQVKQDGTFSLSE